MAFHVVHDLEEPARPAIVVHKLLHLGEERQSLIVDLGRHAAGVEHLEQMSRQTEACDVGAGVDAHLDHGLACCTVELGHTLYNGGHVLVAHQADFMRGGHNARTQRLREIQGVAGLGTVVAHDAVGMHHTHDGKAVLGLIVLDGVAAHHERAGLPGLVGTAAHDLAGHVGAKRAREGHEVECHDRLGAHGIHVGDGVGRSHAPEVVGVVNHRGEEVGREHDGDVVGQLVNSRVVARREALQQVGVGVMRSDVRKNLLKLRGAPLGRAAALGGKLREAQRLALRHSSKRRCDGSGNLAACKFIRHGRLLST